MKPVSCDIITIAAINLNNNAISPKEYEKITKDKIRLMLSIPFTNGVENLILGAWGCGVFNNEPNVISQYFKDVILNEGYNTKYKKLHKHHTHTHIKQQQKVLHNIHVHLYNNTI